MSRWPFWFGFLLPFLALYLLDWILFVFTLASVIKNRKRVAKKNVKPTNKLLITKESLFIAISLAVFFGLGWGFGLLATSSSIKGITFTFQVLFSIFVGLQGLLLFILRGLRNPDARRVWRKFSILKNGRLTISFTVSSTKTVSKSDDSANHYKNVSRPYILPQKTSDTPESAVHTLTPQSAVSLISADSPLYDLTPETAAYNLTPEFPVYDLPSETPVYAEINLNDTNSNSEEAGYNIERNTSYGQSDSFRDMIDYQNFNTFRKFSLMKHDECLEEDQLSTSEHIYDCPQDL